MKNEKLKMKNEPRAPACGRSFPILHSSFFISTK